MEAAPTVSERPGLRPTVPEARLTMRKPESAAR